MADERRFRAPVDLHTHSSVSDGTETPAELVRAAAVAGIGTGALTDHDSTAGWQDAAAEGGDHRSQSAASAMDAETTSAISAVDR